MLIPLYISFLRKTALVLFLLLTVERFLIDTYVTQAKKKKKLPMVYSFIKFFKSTEGVKVRKPCIRARTALIHTYTYINTTFIFEDAKNSNQIGQVPLGLNAPELFQFVAFHKKDFISPVDQRAHSV